jgi:nucleoid-associated protein YgaU
MAQTQDQLKAKYQSVLNTIQQVNGSLKNVNMEGDKLLIRAEVANDQVKNDVWNAIKQVDASYSDLHADIIVDSSPTPPAAGNGDGVQKRTYKVQPGDNLSKIAQQFYGKATEYDRIFQANRDQLSDPDHVRAGMELVIPA